MGELIVFSIPSAVYLAVLGRRSRLGPEQARQRLGLSPGTPSGWALAAGIALPLLGLVWLVAVLIPADLAATPGVVIAQLTGLGAVVGTIAQTLGEEILFRGLIAGVLMRRLGVAAGNTAQAAVFLLPHLILLAVDPSLWPILPVQFVAGWLLGWLRHRAGSVLPGAAIHAAANLLAGLLAP